MKKQQYVPKTKADIPDLPMPVRKWLRVDEAAKYLNVHPGVLNKMRTEKRGPRYSKAGNCVWYSTAALDEYVESHEVVVGAA